MWTRIKDALVAFLIPCIYWFLRCTWRAKSLRRPPVLDTPRAKVYAHFHGDELLLIGLFMRTGLGVLVSHSRDGERLKRILERMGYWVTRGSSSRGGAQGLRALIRTVGEDQRSAALAVDGPRGPIYKVKPGIIELAQKSGAPLILGGAAARKRFVFKKAWNRCYLPLPFSECVVVYGEPIQVPSELSPDDFEAMRLRVEGELVRLKREAEATYGRRDPELSK